ncbi:MAG: septum formation protein Maf [Lachnospiraceae bacterium]|nr:septum formation protein Maf [Lachnospiraceae bacterium]
MKKIILASQSPRRKELLAQAGIEFQIITSDVEEKITHTKPRDIAESLSSQKAEDVYHKLIEKYGEVEARNFLVVGADTIVAIEDRILGKPVDRADAYEMMKLLSGKTHQVYTGVTVLTMSEDKKPHIHTFHECTDVTFYDITDEEINQYLDAGDEWADKAGAYGIQATVGAKFVKELKGDYNNVVGLPVARLYQELKKILDEG